MSQPHATSALISSTSAATSTGVRLRERSISPSATRSAKNGSTKIRWRDSGDVDCAEPREDERGRGHEHDAGRQERRVAIPEPQGTRADDRDHEHGDHHRREPGGEVARDPVQVLEHRARPVELLPAGADTDVEPSGEDVVAVPEGRPEHGDGGERDERRSRARAREDIHDLRGEDEGSVRVRRDRRQDRHRPERPASLAALRDRGQEGDVRERAREQEEAVHPPVDPVEEEHPARRHERRGRECGSPPREARAEERHDRDRGDREQRREEPQADEAAAQVGD